MDERMEQNDRSVEPAAWVDRYGDYLYRYALSRLRDVESAEEVVQETFLSGLRHVDQYAGRGSERAWLLGILKRKIIDLVRERCRRAPMDQGEGDEVSERLFDERGNWSADVRQLGPQPSAAMERQEFWEAFRGCLQTLPVKQADVFTLREMDGRTSEEICKDLEISPSNLWVLLYRARLRLSNCMKSRWQHDAGS